MQGASNSDFQPHVQFHESLKKKGYNDILVQLMPNTLGFVKYNKNLD